MELRSFSQEEALNALVKRTSPNGYCIGISAHGVPDELTTSKEDHIKELLNGNSDMLEAIDGDQHDYWVLCFSSEKNALDKWENISEDSLLYAGLWIKGSLSEEVNED